jgi:hypothetical protein
MNTKQYIREIIQRSCLPAGDRKRLKADLENEIKAALERGETIEQIMDRMGDPDKIAAEIYENYAEFPERPFREYKSKRTLFGLPLIHIIRLNYGVPVPHARAGSARFVNIGGRFGYPGIRGIPTARGVFAFGPKAKGIIAIGNISSGFISVGNISAGMISIGNISAGILSLGNFALALLVALGNFAAGLLSAGNAVFGYGTAGNMAIGKYAIGNYIRGTDTFKITNLYNQMDEVRQFFAGLKAPAPVKAFYGFIEKISAAITDPMSVLPYYIIINVILAAIIAALIIVPRRLVIRNLK